MNTTKLLCKYFDLEEKGYVNGADITLFTIIIIFIATLFIAMFASIGFMFFNGIDAHVPELAELYTLLNVGVGVVVGACGVVLIYTTWLILKTFFKHKFAICERDNK